MDRKHQQYADIINWNPYETIKYFRRYWLRLGKRIQWLWTATGETLLRTTLDAEGATETKRYAGGFTYRDADGSGANEEA